MRRSPLKRHTQSKRAEAGRVEWKEPHAGFCQCGCNRFSMHLHRHHVVYEQIVRREGGDPWALANSMLLHENCHAAQHSGFRRIHVENLPLAAVDFARRLLGEDRAALFIDRYYRPQGERVAA